jgi:hypothetical protein|tara:strand:- start:857 stop:1246 length:390 start_codon:yes stop_codon:yes gene_type:complete
MFTYLSPAMNTLFKKAEMRIAMANYDNKEGDKYEGALPDKIYEKYYIFCNDLMFFCNASVELYNLKEIKTFEFIEFGSSPEDILNFINDNGISLLMDRLNKLHTELREDMIDYMYKYNPAIIKDKNKQN